jgi:multidrug efflux pump subunit AcrA (membrane-fusion protein)
MIKRTIALIAVAAAIIGAGAGLSRGLRAVIEATSAEDEAQVPTTTVRRGVVDITVPGKGELQGGGSESLMAPMAGVPELPITFLRAHGELVDAGDIIAEFDPGEQEYNLIEAAADLEEAQQRLLQAEADGRVALEEARLQAATAEADLRIAVLEMGKNEVLAAILQRQNAIALERAENRQAQAVRDLEHRESTSDASLDVRRAAVNEASAKADMARSTMADLTLRAETSGYIQLGENLNGLSFIYSGMQIPQFQLGDAVRPGQLVARIPDMSRWEVSAEIPETDRAYLEVGQEVIVRPAATPDREFLGHISSLGGSSGNAWERTFNCRIALDETAPDLRPGMSTDILINVEILDDVLWIPSQALFDSEGGWYVYRQTPDGYITHDVQLIRRTESQAVITGIDEGVAITLARPGIQTGISSRSDGPLGALSQ